MKKVFFLLTAMILSTGVWALDNVPYVDVDGTTKYANNVTEITNESGTLTAGWYVVNGADVQTGSLFCQGDVYLILADGATLTSQGSGESAGVQVSGGFATLTIYGQTAQTGTLRATGTDYGGAGIGGGRSSGNGCIIINGGIIHAQGGWYASGIGGGYSGRTMNDGIGQDITINGGVVNAGGGNSGAGIGGGAEACGKNININGGKVTAVGGSNAAAIGGGSHGTASGITIRGGEVVAHGGYNSAGKYYSMGIGAGTNGTAASGIYVADGLYVRADNHNPPYTLIPHTGITNDIASSVAEKAFVRISTDEHVVGVRYTDAEGASKTTDALLVTNATKPVIWNNDWYVVYDNVTLRGVVCQGDVKLILTDGAKLTTTGADNEAGIRVSGEGNSLTIYVQSAQTGQLIATGGTNGAGIGGANGGDGSHITILGGLVTATGGANASGIGGGAGGSASDIYIDARRAVKAGTSANPTAEIEHALTTDIATSLTGKRYAKIVPGAYMYNVEYVDENGERKMVDKANFIWEDMSERKTWNAGWYAIFGNVTYHKGIICHGAVHLILVDGTQLTAISGENGEAGIRVSGSGNSLTIYGQSGQSGKLNASANYLGAGIGGQNSGSSSNITINGGVVNASGGWGAAGIGGGSGRSGSNITIRGGVITAAGGYDGAGIGGGSGGSGSDITILGGVVTATSGGEGAGIGGGEYGHGKNITIRGGKVTATGGYRGAGIGGGDSGDCSNVTISGGVVTATGGWSGAGIGSGYSPAIGTGVVKSTICSDIKIEGGTIMAVGGDEAAGIGPGSDGTSQKIYVNSPLTLLADNNNPPVTEISHSSTTDMATDLKDYRYAMIYMDHYKGIRQDVDYVDADGTVKTAKDAVVMNDTMKVLMPDEWYAVLGSDVQTHSLTCTGAAHLILADGARLTATGETAKAGIEVSDFYPDAAITIYGQTAQTGKLIAKGASGAAGIGGGSSDLRRNGQNISIYGGVIEATAGRYGAGIGAGRIGVATNIHVAESLVVRADNTNPPTTIIAHTSTQDIASSLADKQYTTIKPAIVVTTHYAENMDANYGTYYNSTQAYEVITENVTLYTASLATYGSETYLDLHAIEGNILPKGTPVIMKLESESQTTENVTMVEYFDSTEGISIPSNSLSGTDDGTTVTANTVYTMAGEVVDGVVTLGFYLFDGTEIPAHKAYLQLPAGTPAPRRIGFGKHVPTGVENTAADVKVEKILRDGQLLIKKGDVLYTVQGALVKQ